MHWAYIALDLLIVTKHVVLSLACRRHTGVITPAQLLLAENEMKREVSQISSEHLTVIAVTVNHMQFLPVSMPSDIFIAVNVMHLYAK